jgi:hypothetical protein
MPVPKLGARPTSLTITSPSVNITSIKSAKPIDGPTIIEELTGDSRQMLPLLSNELQGFEVVTNDLSVWRTLKKGTICTTAKLSFAGAINSDGTTHSSGAISRTLSTCVQVNDLEPDFQAAGQPPTLTLRFVLCRKAADGADGTVTDEVFAGGGG